MALILPAELQERLVAATLAGLPEEACGLLIGRCQAGVTEVECVVQARNLARERRQDLYEVHPEDFLAADRLACAQQAEIVGVWHSHPESPGRPSATDQERAFEGWSYIIVGRDQSGAREVRSWRLAGEHFQEEPVLRPAGEHQDPLLSSDQAQGLRSVSLVAQPRAAAGFVSFFASAPRIQPVTGSNQ